MSLYTCFLSRANNLLFFSESNKQQQLSLNYFFTSGGNVSSSCKVLVNLDPHYVGNMRFKVHMRAHARTNTHIHALWRVYDMAEPWLAYSLLADGQGLAFVRPEGQQGKACACAVHVKLQLTWQVQSGSILQLQYWQNCRNNRFQWAKCFSLL